MTAEPTLPAVPRSRWSGLRAFTSTEVRVQLHEVLAIATAMVVQVVFLVFVGVLASQYLPYVLIGAVIFSTFQIGQRVQNESAYIRIDHKLNELYHASPMTAEAYFLGMAAGVGLAYLPPIGILFGVTVYLVHLTVLVALAFAGILAAVWLFAASIGYIFSTFFHDMRAIWPYSTLFYNLFGVLPPVFYPIWLFPASARPLALVLPTSGATALADAITGVYRVTGPDLVLAATSLVGFAVSTFVLATVWARRTIRER
jgi:ABC-2 type transport system permease protein